MIDIAIIGLGPAGMSAAINAKIRNKDIILIGRSIETSALYKAEKVSNYLGINNISGKQLLNNFYKHVEDMDIKIHRKKVLQIVSMGKHFTLNIENKFIESRTIIIATGVATKNTIEGEKQYIGKGLSYCPTCDGMLYRNKTVVIISENEEGEEEALYLNEICQKIYYVPKYKINNQLKDIQIITDTPKEIIGTNRVSGLKLNETTLECDGIFIINETAPVDSLIYGLEIINNAIKVDKNMQTNIKGIFAAGDCTGKPLQISKAIGEGQIAAQSAVHFLHEYK